MYMSSLYWNKVSTSIFPYWYCIISNHVIGQQINGEIVSPGETGWFGRSKYYLLLVLVAISF